MAKESLGKQVDEMCSGEHRFFSLDPIGVEASGKVTVIIVCTACGEFRRKDFEVAKPGTPIVSE